MTIQAQSADGTVHEFPDGTSPDVIDKVMKGYATPQSPLGSNLVDAVRSIPGGLAKGIAGLAGLPGDLESAGQWLGQKGAQAFQGATGIDPHIGSGPVPNTFPTSNDISDTISKPFGGYYEPKGLAGDFAQTVAEFAPNAIAPGGIGARIARVLAGAIPSEVAGEATKGTAAEPYARAAGGVAGSLGQGLAEALANRAPATAPPSLDDLNQMKDATYKAADQAGVVIKPQSFQQFATNLGTDLTKNNVVQSDIHKNALSALSIIQDEAASGAPISLSRADAIRQAVGNAAEQASAPGSNGGDLRLVMKVKDGLDNYLDALKPNDVLLGDPATTVPILKDARDLAQRSFKATEIQKMIDLAKNSASTNYSASGEEQALRVQFKNLNAQLIKDPSKAASFTDDERDAIQKVAQGGTLVNGLRWLGKLAPTNVISGGVGAGGGAALGSALGGPIGAGVGAVAIPAVGGAARFGANAITNKNAELAAALMRAGPNAPSINPGATQLPPDVLKRLLLSGLLSQSEQSAAQPQQ